MSEGPGSPTIGNRLAPARFILFALLLAAAAPAAITWLRDWRLGAMAGFDLAAAVFLLSCLPLLRVSDPKVIAAHAQDNDANRTMLLAITFIVMLAVLASIAALLAGRGSTAPGAGALVVATLLLAWLFTNAVYALHYAHLHYLRGGGLAFPGTDTPDYADFTYFAFTLGMTFQTSDVTIADGAIRRVVTLHCIAAFIFNLGVLAFTINLLGG